MSRRWRGHPRETRARMLLCNQTQSGILRSWSYFQCHGERKRCAGGHAMNVQNKAWSETHLLAYWVICTLGMLVGFAFVVAGLFTLVAAFAAWWEGMARRISTGSVAEDILVILGAAVSLVLGFMLLR